MDLERERGITIKAHPVRLNYTADDGQQYVLNLIDTPGHVDFSYEVTRSLAACEGALLLVDASQGVEAQTLANAYLAVEHNLEIIPVINKIDLPSAQPEEARRQLEDIIGLDGAGAILASAKEGRGVKEILEAIVLRLHPPKGDPDAPLKALIFDLVRLLSWRRHCRPRDRGHPAPGMKIRLMATPQDHEVDELGVFTPKPVLIQELGPGEVGFLACGIKIVGDAQIGDTVTEANRPTPEPYPGFKPLKPMVFAGLYPVEGHRYQNCARRWRSCGSTTRLSSSSRKRRPRSGSDSAADSSDCCTWRSCRSGSSANSTWSSSPRRPACCTA